MTSTSGGDGRDEQTPALGAARAARREARASRPARFALTALITTLLLVAAGAYTRGSGSGYGCQDRWPLCEGGALGGLLPRADSHMIVEWTHRWLAAVVGVLVLATAVVAWRERPRRGPVVWPAVAATVVVGIQAWLGRLVVQNELPRDLVALHLAVALTVAALLTVTTVNARSVAGGGPAVAPETGRRWSVLVAVGAALTFAVVVLGSTVHNEYVGGWPLVDGKLIPAFGHRVVILNFAHRVAAGLGFVFVGWLAWRVPRLGRPRAEVRLVHTALACYAVNVALGAVHVFTEVRHSGVVVAHLLVASIAWVCLVAAALMAYRRPADLGERSPEPLLVGSGRSGPIPTTAARSG